MSYTKTNWKSGDTITAEKLNNIETGIETASVLVPTPQGTDIGKVLTVGSNGDVSWEESARGTCMFHYTHAVPSTVVESASYGEFVTLIFESPSIEVGMWENAEQTRTAAISFTADTTTPGQSILLFNTPNLTDLYIEVRTTK